jgi:hypothetical protein
MAIVAVPDCVQRAGLSRSLAQALGAKHHG